MPFVRRDTPGIPARGAAARAERENLIRATLKGPRRSLAPLHRSARCMHAHSNEIQIETTMRSRAPIKTGALPASVREIEKFDRRGAALDHTGQLARSRGCFFSSIIEQ